jgi:hypothetical protein
MKKLSIEAGGDGPERRLEHHSSLTEQGRFRRICRANRQPPLQLPQLRRRRRPGRDALPAAGHQTGMNGNRVWRLCWLLVLLVLTADVVAAHEIRPQLWFDQGHGQAFVVDRAGC